MRLISFLGISLVVVMVSAKLTPGEEKCMKEVGITGEDVEMYEYSPMDPETREQKCYWGCIFQASGFIDKEGKRFSRNGYLNAVLPQARNNERLKKSMLKQADKCEGLAHEDRCELGWMVMECFGLTASAFDRRIIKN